MVKKPAVQLRILSYSSLPFADREEAGKLLAAQLSEYRRKNAVVLGMPRGGVVIAREIAVDLEAELDIVLARKLRTPGHEELAMGSVTEDGKIFLNPEVVEGAGVGEDFIHQEKTRQMAEIKRRTGLFRRARPKIELKGRIVMVTAE